MAFISNIILPCMLSQAICTDESIVNQPENNTESPDSTMVPVEVEAIHVNIEQPDAVLVDNIKKLVDIKKHLKAVSKAKKAAVLKPKYIKATTKAKLAAKNIVHGDANNENQVILTATAEPEFEEITPETLPEGEEVIVAENYAPVSGQLPSIFNTGDSVSSPFEQTVEQFTEDIGEDIDNVINIFNTAKDSLVAQALDTLCSVKELVEGFSHNAGDYINVVKNRLSSVFSVLFSSDDDDDSSESESNSA